MDHGTFRELAAGAALDDLDASERASLDGHVRACGSCRDLAREAADVAGMLALAVPQRRPPGALRGAMLAAISGSEGRPVAMPAAILSPAGGAAALGRPFAVAAAEPVATQPIELARLRRDRARYRRLALAGLAIAAALAVAVGSLGAATIGLGRQLEAATRERDAAVARLATNDQAMAVVLAPDHATATMTPDPVAAGASVYVVYRPGTSDSWMMAGDLPATPTGHVYQLWSADASGVHPLTTFTCDGAHACLAPYGVDLRTAKATMITLEPAGGSAGEPGPQVAFGTIQG